MKKLTALFLVMAMMAGMMVGCSSNETTPDTTAQNPSTQAEKPSTKAAPMKNTFNYEAVKNTTGKEVRFAVLTTQTNAF